jgi:AcrR family transcriptional regulator
MGVAERKERQRAELREQILAAARRIVLDEGFDALTMRKIGDAIEYSPATIYLYFENREAIGRQLCAESFEHLITYMAPTAQIADSYERLRGIGRSYTRFGFENPEEYRLLFMTDSAFLETLFPLGKASDDEDAGERAFQFVVDAFRAAQAAGAIRPDGDPVVLGEMVWTACHGVVSMALTCSKALETPPEAIADMLCDTMLRGLVVPVTSTVRSAP